MADEQDSDSCAGYRVWVQVPSSALIKRTVWFYVTRFFLGSYSICFQCKRYLCSSSCFLNACSSFILSTINSAVFLSNILNASENILCTSSCFSIFSCFSFYLHTLLYLLQQFNYLILLRYLLWIYHKKFPL